MGLFRMGDGAAGTGAWERWGWALLIAAFLHAGALMAALSVPHSLPKAPPAPPEPELVLLTFVAPPAAAPAVMAQPETAPQRLLSRTRARPSRPMVVPRVPEKLPVPQEVVEAPPEEAPAPEAFAEEEEVLGAGAVGNVVAGLVSSAAKPGEGSGLGVTSGGEAVDLKQVSRPPEVLKQVVPQYPRQARSRRIVGLVLVRVIVGVDGRVEPEHTRIIRSVPELDAAATAAVSQWRFSPALGRHGRPVRVIIDIPVQFSLK
ncbi:energy transducer TonB [Hyalangium rubrum]|uniref:Energy transducer TonB n=1 Tax=Hyalangium rubrum TaxID=3103134 RepID=A0ABU5GYA3_9BACT|nr:energy transducer TonB [Hyalangium sp. s54d21]MDY7225478.1 energy transducer TonB [Hyalangium sp. s54d21]